MLNKNEQTLILDFFQFLNVSAETNELILFIVFIISQITISPMSYRVKYCFPRNNYQNIEFLFL